MINLTSGQDIYTGNINVDYTVLKDSEKTVNSAQTLIFQGSPVSLNSSGELILCPSVTNTVLASRVYGLSLVNKNSILDETTGDLGTYGSPKLTVVCNGIVTVRPFKSVDPTTGTVTSVAPWYSAASNYVPGTPLYVKSYTDP